ncbi:hypothetical protein ZWY2020_036168 [Hordeum vulgare]|nr:hypothetical protein ZWY2020_036168 [Hordeum vulgare]
MIGWGDVYKVVSAMAPLYFALGLGYASVRWWKSFTRDQCDAVNRLVIYFALPFFSFDFNAHAGTFAASYRVLAADAVAKLVVVLAIAGWVASCRWRHWSRVPKAPPARPGPSWSWCITGYSLGTLNNGLFVGVPLLDAMYGKWARDIVVQLSVLQAVVWLPLLVVAFEVRQAWLEVTSAPAPDGAREEGGPAELGSERPAAAGDGRNRKTAATGWAFWAPLLRTVGLKVAGNPNVYASLLGVVWSSVANRWHLEMPDIVDGSIWIMSRTGLGIGMFNTAALPQSLGAFIFAQEYELHAGVLSTVVIVGTLASLPVLATYYVVLGLM